MLDPPAGGVTYRQAASELGGTEDDIRNALYECRLHLREALRQVISSQAASPSEVEEELRELFGNEPP